jgi:hypothetical protein
MSELDRITVTIIGTQRAAQEIGWDVDDVIWTAADEGVLIDSLHAGHAAAFGVSQYYVPEAWLRALPERYPSPPAGEPEGA